MKYAILAATLAGLGLCATGAAQAQSSVTLYGVVDLSLGHVTGSRTQMHGVSPQTNGTSRFGLRGSEDLGSGYRAEFNLESEIRPEDGTGAATGGGINFARAAYLNWVTPAGSVKLGRTLTPSYNAFTVWELTQAANYNVVNSQFGYTGLGSRHNAELSYTTPRMGGWQATLGHIVAADNANVSKNDFTVSYREGPLTGSLAVNKLSNTGRNWSLGAAYDFGPARVAGSLQDARGAGRGKGFTLGVRVPAGSWSFIADLARDTDKSDTDWLLEARYSLSRRTFVYAALVSNGKGKTPTETRTSLIGLRHNF